MIALLVAAACATTILTVGRATAAEAQLESRLDSAGARLINVQDVSGDNLIQSGTITILDGFSTVERTFALSLPVDAETGAQGAGGTRIPVWEMRGTITDAVALTRGRLPGQGEAIISATAARAAGLDAPVGIVTAGTNIWAVVGFYVARAPFGDLDTGIVAPANPVSSTPQLYLVARSSADVQAAANDVRSVIAPVESNELAFTVPSTLAELQASLGADLGGLGHALLLLILAAGSLLVAIVVFADTLVRRTDLGRRRALGMPRNTLVAFILIRTASSATGGSILGCITGVVLLLPSGAFPPLPFVLATGALAAIVAPTAALFPAAAAALRDPVTVLRTP
ncbi:permease [Galbitalea sp. SE-J8]|uniref:FtsX-like permease family protein n=1 Tax=Galbitalea sp. SE-J8 TaxID=3054952 RepID=UPI00259C7A2E|nr:FtsX-like permease family protein [Galbitalea sp. SE-J8]MDM4763715.1 permease [Galbitalea sp. SE-J8]